VWRRRRQRIERLAWLSPARLDAIFVASPELDEPRSPVDGWVSLANFSLPRGEHCGESVIFIVVERWVLVVAVVRIKSPAPSVRRVLRSPQKGPFVRIAVQGVLPNPPQSGEFVAKLVARLEAARGGCRGFEWRRVVSGGFAATVAEPASCSKNVSRLLPRFR
jgi:hypothetical protein